MKNREIVCIWESPTNEGTECYRVGYTKKIYGTNDGKWGTIEEWKVSKITELGGGMTHETDVARIEVYDENNRLRVSLPRNAVVIEWNNA